MIKTGRLSQINDIPCSTFWSTSRTYDNKSYAAACTGGGMGRTQGNSNETGQLAGLGSPPAAITPGSEYTFVGIKEDGDSVGGTILITGLNVTIPIEANDPVSWTADFGVQGVLTPGTAAATAVDPANTTVKKGAGVATVPVFGAYSMTNARSASLSISVPVKTYISGGTTYREAGNLEASATVEVYDDNPYRSELANTLLEVLEIGVDATTHWEFGWCRVDGFSNYRVDRATQDLLGYTVNFGWSNNDDIASPTSLGHIIRPDGSYLIGSA